MWKPDMKKLPGALPGSYLYMKAVDTAFDKKKRLTTVSLSAPQVGLEPTTLRLTAECSAIELLRNISILFALSRERDYYTTFYKECQPLNFILLPCFVKNF